MSKYIKNAYIVFSLIGMLLLIVYFVLIHANKNYTTILNGCDNENSRFIKHKIQSTYYKITYCDKYYENIMTLTSAFIPKSEYVSFDYIGNPQGPNTSLYIEDAYGNKYTISDAYPTGAWTERLIKLPVTLRDKIRLVAVDKSATTSGWIGIGGFRKVTLLGEIRYLETMGAIWIFAFFISMIFAYFYRKNTVLLAYIYMSLFVGISALVAFYAYFYSLTFGKIFSILLALFVLYNFFTLNRRTKSMTFLLFVGIISIISIIMFLGYGHFDTVYSMQEVSANAWHHLPVDNWIPKIFANAILNEHISAPLVGSWLSSDRPPLQTGLYLIFTPLTYSDILYLVVSVGAQLLIIPFLVFFLSRYIVSMLFLFVMINLLYFNGFVFVHGLFVWPKLFSSLYQGIALYALYSIWTKPEKDLFYYLMFGIASALAFLAHGGSVFYLLGLALLLLMTIRKKEELKNLFYGLLSSLLLYLPWMLYQKYVDPPGDRLLKRHLASQYDITSDSFLQVLVHYYQHMTFTEWLALRWTHLKSIFYDIYWDLFHNFTHVVHMGKMEFRSDVFFATDYSYVFFSSFFIMLYPFVRKRMQTEKYFVDLLVSSFLLYVLFWTLIISTETIIHQGAYFGWFSGILAVMFIVYRIHYLLFYALGILNLIEFYRYYVSDGLFVHENISSMIVLVMVVLFLFTLWRLIKHLHLNDTIKNTVGYEERKNNIKTQKKGKLLRMSWGMYPPLQATLLRFRGTEALKKFVITKKNLIAYGNGRSYGDSALSENMLLMKSHNYFLNFNEENGLLHIESGVLLSEILDAFVPRGWFLKITPGTKLITVGGAIASDVHGKNHHVEGCFSECVKEFKIMLSSGEVVLCNKEKTPELWNATCGGMGLTGIILEVKMYLQKIYSQYIKQTSIKTRNLKETFEAFEQYKDTPYSVAWIDCLAKKENIGRCILMVGDFYNDGNLKYKAKEQRTIPFNFPGFMLNKWTVKAFNWLYYRHVKEGVSHQKVDIDTFFYPLDAIGKWNRIYGKNGFTQYQFILPKGTSYAGLEEILLAISNSGKGSFLAVLKLYGKANNNWLSFPMEGYSLALDFKIEKGLFTLLKSLDKIVLKYGGRIYLTKDVRVSKETFEKGYPKIGTFRTYREEQNMDTKFHSLQSKRVGI